MLFKFNKFDSLLLKVHLILSLDLFNVPLFGALYNPRLNPLLFLLAQAPIELSFNHLYLPLQLFLHRPLLLAHQLIPLVLYVVVCTAIVKNF